MPYLYGMNDRTYSFALPTAETYARIEAKWNNPARFNEFLKKAIRTAINQRNNFNQGK
jgi:hypothetical protein